jgi:hypothetical protein
METSTARAQLLALLGFGAGNNPGEAAIETARTKLCAMLQLPATSTDEMIIDVARRIGYQPAARSEMEEQSKPKPAADANELAGLGKRTSGGLGSLASMKTTQSGIKPLHSRVNAAKQAGDEPPAEGDEAAQAAAAEQQQAAAQQQAAEKRSQAQSLRTSAQFQKLDKPSIWQKLGGMFKKDSDQ